MLLAGAGLAVWLAIAVGRRHAPGARTFAAMMLAVSWWCFTSAMHQSVPTLDAKFTWAQLQYLAIATAPSLWLFFIADYAGAAWVHRRHSLLPFAVIPALTLVAAATAHSHQALWTTVTMGADGVASYGHGWWFWTSVAYIYGLMTAGVWYLMKALRHAPAYRGQVRALIAAGLIPWAGNVLYLSGLVVIDGLDLTPVGFTLSGTLFAWALYRQRIFDLVPIAREQLVDSLGDAVLVIDDNRAVLDMNRAARELAGNPPAWLGRPVDDLVPMLRDHALNADGMKFVVETATPTAWHDVRVTRVQTRQTAWLVLVRDITDRRQEAAEREALVRKRGEFVATVAHELRTPMFSVQGALQLVIGSGRSTLAPADNRLLGNALRSCERLARIVSEILHLSMIEAEPELPRQDPVAADRLVSDALFDVGRLAADKAITIDNQVPPDLPMLLGDHDRLVQVLVNLISNAIKHGPAGSTVTLSSQLEDGVICLAVADQGPGISEELIGRLFHRFQRGDPETAAATPGTGLGLAISRVIVEQHGGRIAVESTPGAGATFRVYLPQALGAPQPRRADTTVFGHAPAARARANAARLLVADDDPDVRDIVAEALERRGFIVTTASDGQEALDVLERQPIDAAILDLQMPRRDGRDVIRTVRASGRDRTIPILVLTGNAGEGTILAEGADALLTKPTDLKRLVSQVDRLLLKRPPPG